MRLNGISLGETGVPEPIDKQAFKAHISIQIYICLSDAQLGVKCKGSIDSLTLNK